MEWYKFRLFTREYINTYLSIPMYYFCCATLAEGPLRHSYLYPIPWARISFFVISVPNAMYRLKMVIFDMVKWGRVHYAGCSTPWCMYNNLYTNCPLLHQKVSNSLVWASIFSLQLKQGAWLKQWTILPGHTLLKPSETKLHCTNLRSCIKT